MVPFSVVPAVLSATVPASSLRPQRPTNPGADPESSEFMVLWISSWLRAMFQIRTSSTAPSKEPAGVFSELSAVPSDAGTVLAAAGG
jgi:hypothetical protein